MLPTISGHSTRDHILYNHNAFILLALNWVILRSFCPIYFHTIVPDITSIIRSISQNTFVSCWRILLTTCIVRKASIIAIIDKSALSISSPHLSCKTYMLVKCLLKVTEWTLRLSQCWNHWNENSVHTQYSPQNHTRLQSEAASVTHVRTNNQRWTDQRNLPVKVGILLWQKVFLPGQWEKRVKTMALTTHEYFRSRKLKKQIV